VPVAAIPRIFVEWVLRNLRPKCHRPRAEAGTVCFEHRRSGSLNKNPQLRKNLPSISTSGGARPAPSLLDGCPGDGRAQSGRVAAATEAVAEERPAGGLL
jgi:hypothetical protein